jgi:hypothetical protein
VTTSGERSIRWVDWRRAGVVELREGHTWGLILRLRHPIGRHVVEVQDGLREAVREFFGAEPDDVAVEYSHTDATTGGEDEDEETMTTTETTISKTTTVKTTTITTRTTKATTAEDDDDQVDVAGPTLFVTYARLLTVNPADLAEIIDTSLAALLGELEAQDRSTSDHASRWVSQIRARGDVH